MNNLLHKIMDECTVKFNKDVTEGTAKKIFKTIPEYLDGLFSSSIKSLSNSVDLHYLGYRHVPPKEEFEKTILKKEGTITYDLARNDVILVEYRFEYMGTPFIRYLYLPFADRGNIITFGDTKYHVLPVLSDTVISPDDTKVFVRLNKAKITFKSLLKNFIVNNQKVSGQLVHAEILKVNKKQITDNIGKPLVSAGLYLAGKFGIINTIKKYGGCTEVYVTTDDIEKFRDKYDVYESTKIRPRGLKDFGYKGHDVKIVISRDYKDLSFINNFIFGIIYTLDVLPKHAYDLVDIIANQDLNNEIMFWRIMIGRVAYQNSFSIDRIADDLREHYEVIDGYIDTQIKQKLSEANIYVEDFFDLLAIILSNYNNWLINSKEYNTDINNRYIDMLYYILYDIFIGFNKVILAINKRASKKVLNMKELIKIFNNEFSSRKIYGLTKSTEMNLAISMCDYTSDIMYPKITSVLEDQSRGQGVRRGGKGQMPESVKTLKASHLGYGSMLFLGKETPSPSFKINIFVNYVVESGKIYHPENIIRTLEKIDTLLLGRGDDSRILEAELTTPVDIEKF